MLILHVPVIAYDNMIQCIVLYTILYVYSIFVRGRGRGYGERGRERERVCVCVCMCISTCSCIFTHSLCHIIVIPTLILVVPVVLPEATLNGSNYVSNLITRGDYQQPS